MKQRGWIAVALAGLVSCSGDGSGNASDASLAEGGEGGMQSQSGGSGAAGVGGAGVGGTGGVLGLGGNTSVGSPEELADRYARASAVVGSCIPDDGINRQNSYLWYAASNARLWGLSGAQAECLATQRGGCGAVTACIGWDIAITAEPCTDGCSGSTFSLCADGYRIRVDCSKLGLACDPIAICSDSPAAACDRETFVNSCDASELPIFCDDGAVFQGPDCAALGLGCSVGSCIGTGDVCDGGNRSSQGDVFYDGIACDGQELISCVFGREHRLDCASVAPGFACQSYEGDAFCGIASECLPAAPGEGSGPEETCDGDSVVFCNAGRVERVACPELGFEGCDPANGAHCTPTFESSGVQ